MKWEAGRLGTGYRKLLLACGKTWDAWLLHTPPGVGIPMHVDNVTGYEHYRLNVVLKSGGASMLLCGRSILRIGKRVRLFRATRRHMVTETRSHRLVLSFGFLRARA